MTCDAAAAAAAALLPIYDGVRRSSTCLGQISFLRLTCGGQKSNKSCSYNTVVVGVIWYV